MSICLAARQEVQIPLQIDSICLDQHLCHQLAAEKSAHKCASHDIKLCAALCHGCQMLCDTQ